MHDYINIQLCEQCGLLVQYSHDKLMPNVKNNLIYITNDAHSSE